MKPEEEMWAARWEQVRQIASGRPELTVGEMRIGELAHRTGLPWFSQLDRQRATEYLNRDYSTLMACRGFGRIKRDRLIAILEAAVVRPPDELAVAPMRLDPCARLVEWGVSENYPTAVLPLPARVLGFCEQEKLASLGQLVRTAETLGERGLLGRPNLGRKSIGELLGLIEALRQGDRPQAGHWLPLSENGSGLSLGAAIKRLLSDLDVRQRPMLERRLVQEMTLEEAAQIYQLTRERVRQIARDFLLDPLQRLLDAFPVEQNELFQRWLAGHSPAAHLGAFVSEADAALADGSLRELFSDDPEAVATALDQELQFERCHEKLRSSLDFQLHGVDLQTFLEQELPVRMHGAFMEYLFDRNGLAMDHKTGRIGPEKPSLRRLVFALLAEEEEAIPATWLLRLVQEANAFKSLTVEELHGRYRGWAQRYSALAPRKVIWSE